MGQARRRHDGGKFKCHVRKGDEVLILAGKSLEQRGRVVSVDPQRERAIVEGANVATRHQKARGSGPSAQQGGIITAPAPIHLSNLMVVCPTCHTPTRVSHKSGGEGSTRICKRCGEPLRTAAE